MAFDSPLWFMYDVHTMKSHGNGKEKHMHDEVHVMVKTINNRDYEAEISDELKEMLMKELQFGVNLPIDQEFILRCEVVMHHVT